MKNLAKENLVREINKLTLGQAIQLNEMAVNKYHDKSLSAEEREAWDEVSDMAIKRIAKTYAELNKPAKKKASAKLTFEKWEDTDWLTDEREGRYINIDIEVKAETKAEAEAIFDELAEKLEEVADVEISWSTCPSCEEYKKGFYYADSFIIEYEHGFMTEIKKDLMKDFKSVKKEMGIR